MSSEDTMDTEDADQYSKSKKSSHILTMARKDCDLAQYGKTLASIMAAAGLMTKATKAESVWNMHQAWHVLLGPDSVIEDMKDYHCCQMKHYESHKDEEDYLDLWAEICKFQSKSISGSNDMSSKGMVGQLMTCRDSFTQLSGNDEAAHQAQGIFAGSSLCMQLASERQTDITRLLDYLVTIIKYKVLDLSMYQVIFTCLQEFNYKCLVTGKGISQEYESTKN
ncbi:hypothetical protein F5141DRAFT_1059934 [Pisolithus sp. B1]|nr:hypothetical protein F5141DRAFT_1059934 [Pisolithus sp. B1]